MQRVYFHNLLEKEWLKRRKKYVTSTSMSAILGVSSYKTPFEYFHERKGNYEVQFEENERIIWGNRLESAIAYGVAEDLGLEVEPYKVFIETDRGVASSFDFKITKNPNRPRETGLLEIKNVDTFIHKDKWVFKDNLVLEAPPYIEAQAMFQLWVSGSS